MRFRRVVAIVLVVLGAAGCSSSGPDPSPTPTSTVVTSSSPTPPPSTSTAPTLSANATAALAAYRNYKAAVHSAEGNPKSADYGLIEALSVVPERGSVKKELGSFAYNDLAFRGEPPSPRPRLVAEDPLAKPYPKVLLRDCPTAPTSWRPYNVRTGKPAALVESKIAPPYEAAVTVIFLDRRWAVESITVNTTRSCSP